MFEINFRKIETSELYLIKFVFFYPFNCSK